jgi:hypothetical protein
MMPLLPLANLIMPGVMEVIDRLIPDKAAAAAAKLEMEAKIMESIASQNIAQTEVNKIEAASSNLFVAGWRPFTGWVCGVAFAYHFIGLPVLLFVAALAGEPIAAPTFDMDALFTVLMGMLGLGGLRSFDKVKGTSR